MTLSLSLSFLLSPFGSLCILSAYLNLSLQSYPESMLGVMFSGRFAVTKDKKGRPFIEYSLLYPSLFLLFLSLSPPLLSFSFYPSISLGFIWRLDCVLVHVFSRPGRPFAYVLNVLRGLPLDLPSVSSISLSLFISICVAREYIGPMHEFSRAAKGFVVAARGGARIRILRSPNASITATGYGLSLSLCMYVLSSLSRRGDTDHVRQFMREDVDIVCVRTLTAHLSSVMCLEVVDDRWLVRLLHQSLNLYPWWYNPLYYLYYCLV